MPKDTRDLRRYRKRPLIEGKLGRWYGPRFETTKKPPMGADWYRKWYETKWPEYVTEFQARDPDVVHKRPGMVYIMDEVAPINPEVFAKFAAFGAVPTAWLRTPEEMAEIQQAFDDASLPRPPMKDVTPLTEKRQELEQYRVKDLDVPVTMRKSLYVDGLGRRHVLSAPAGEDWGKLIAEAQRQIEDVILRVVHLGEAVDGYVMTEDDLKAYRKDGYDPYGDWTKSVPDDVTGFSSKEFVKASELRAQFESGTRRELMQKKLQRWRKPVAKLEHKK